MKTILSIFYGLDSLSLKGKKINKLQSKAWDLWQIPQVCFPQHQTSVCKCEVLKESLENCSNAIFGYSYLNRGCQFITLPTPAAVRSLQTRWSTRNVLDVAGISSRSQCWKNCNPTSACNQLITYFQKQLKFDCSFNQFSFPFTSSPVVGKLLHSHHSIGWVWVVPELLQIPLS